MFSLLIYDLSECLFLSQNICNSIFNNVKKKIINILQTILIINELHVVREDFPPIFQTIIYIYIYIYVVREDFQLITS